MKRSTERILTSHVGSLPRPAELLALYRSDTTADAVKDGLRTAVADVVRRQLDLGIDVVNDGEYGKPSTSEVADFYASPEAAVAEDPDAPIQVGVNVAEIAYTGQRLVRRDTANLKAALPAGMEGAAFLSAMSAGAEHFLLPGEHYASEEDEVAAMADAMRVEFKAIADAGLIVQVDDPWLVDRFSSAYSMTSDTKAFRRWADGHVELVNHSLEGIAPDRIRLHICWGSWKGPHSTDLPLKDVIDLLLKLDVGLYSVEAANPMHEHEWRVWEEVDVPEDKIVMPGVVTHKTNVLEHPEVVADRIVRYAGAVGRENVIAGTDCGMGGRINPQIAWAKLKALVDGADLASERLWGRGA